jgi:Flp pilus assembly protein TadB
MRLVLLSAVLAWAGLTLLLSEVRWFSRESLVERLQAYGPAGTQSPRRRRVLSGEAFRDVVAPIALVAGERLSRWAGVNEDLAVRLRRVHSPLDVAAFRTRQLGWAVLSVVAVAPLVALGRPSPAIGLLFLAGAPVLAFLVLEQRLAAASDAWKRRVERELPVIAEQLAMLLSAGFSLGAAMNRIADRGRGNCAHDLRRVYGRVRQGLSEREALHEWTALADVEALDRLVAILALNREATDLGRLASDEARAIRRDLHRKLVEAIERRAQTVWIPVTVAALVPGVLFMAVPFIEALRLFSAQ